VGTLPVSEGVSAEVLSLPLWPQITSAIQERVVGALQSALEACAGHIGTPA
jgi:dTDP-4-amino-4,6-dideoxygalactose transaminase